MRHRATFNFSRSVYVLGITSRALKKLISSLLVTRYKLSPGKFPVQFHKTIFTWDYVRGMSISRNCFIYSWEDGYRADWSERENSSEGKLLRADVLDVATVIILTGCARHYLDRLNESPDLHDFDETHDSLEEINTWENSKQMYPRNTLIFIFFNKCK